MQSFSSLKDLLLLLSQEQKLLTELFGKRNALDYRYDYALELADNNADKITRLIDYGIVRENGPYLEIEDTYLSFFEQVLHVNETINVSYIEETLREARQQMLYYLQEIREAQKHRILNRIKSGLRRTGETALRNILDLSRNIENTYKGELNFGIKRARLEYFDRRRQDILTLIIQTEALIAGDEEQTFFSQATDEGLSRIVTDLRRQLTDCRHHLVEVQKQIIEYLNRIQRHSQVLEKLRQLKHLKDQFEIRSKTNIEKLLGTRADVVLEPRTPFSTKLSLPALSRNDELPAIFRKISSRKEAATTRHITLAGAIPEAYLTAQTASETSINIDALASSFLASGYSLFDFIRQYRFPKNLSFEEQLTVFCQVVSQYEDRLSIHDQYRQEAGIEYALVYPR